MKTIYRKVYEQAKPFLRTRENLIHTKIAYTYALKLLMQEDGEEEIVIPAILLHDVGWDSVPEELQLTAFGPNPTNPKLTIVHEVEGARIAEKILNDLHYPPDMAKEICRIIRGHDSRKKPISKSDRIVKDADKLSRYSHRGVAIDSKRFHIPRSTYLSFLEGTINQWFFTPMAKKIAREEISLRKSKK